MSELARGDGGEGRGLEARLLGFVERARDVLTASSSLKKHFADEVRWLQTRQAMWTSRGWRVGLIGITS